MPILLLERIPLPSLRSYVAFSLLMLCSALIFAWNHSEDFVLPVPDTGDPKMSTITKEERIASYRALDYTEYLSIFCTAITSELWSVWSLVNMCYCCLILLGRSVQKFVFGNLRVSELQQLKDKFWNFAFYKFIFIFGVLNVQSMNDAIMWSGWFSIFCGLHLLAQLCQDRFEYLSCSPTTPKADHVKLIFLLVLILLTGFCLLAVAVTIGLYTDWNTFAFMMAECILLLIKCIYVLARYTIYLVDINHDGLWENRGLLAYYTELVCEIVSLTVDLIHHIHMVLWSNIFLSMASLVICMQVRYLFYEIQRRIKRHKNYLEVVKSMEARFSLATPDELDANNDNCAICWDKMESARKLPCQHLFHNSCLRSWLAQDTSCPTCRISLSEPKSSLTTAASNVLHQPIDSAVLPEVEPTGHVPRLNRTNHFFHFDASRYISWLPSFSVEVTHTQMNAQTGTSQNSQLDSMARQVQHVLPGVALSSIVEDLRSTHSVEITVENILEGRVIIQPSSREHPSESLAENWSDQSDDDSTTDQSYSSPQPSHEYTVPGLAGQTSVGGATSMAMSETETTTSGRFSKSAQERENILRARKADLLNRARQRFVDQSQANSVKQASPRNTNEDKKNS